ncbi:hypothetical protein HRG_001494 [Hirsutella rhossiliensis]|uniref:Uncharacterized protein n=1 Tax=Hirsutella rhossiliensis TaxID=111463 RepID=A0A9P8N8D7_9HYPO|nr:uncharacterized protein HRG_01494 [Hirsutella rhossiliensis]KAH0968852.1 hypothetical protein HRG_01494 [Hirsutella rhossiliensis]
MSLEAYTKLPPDDIPNATVDGDTQQKFMKLWDKDKNYTGEPYDLLDDKIRIFMSICYNIQVKPSQFHALFPRILAGRAQTFYIDKIEWTTTFRKAYDSIKQHFDTEVNHVHYYTDSGMDILRTGIESIDSFDAKSYEYRIEFLGVRFDVESATAPFDSHRIERGVPRSTFDSIESNVAFFVRQTNRTEVHFSAHRIERHPGVRPNSIESIE